MKMSLHRALIELKMLNKRILSAVSGTKYVTYQIGAEAPKGFKSKEEFDEEALKGFQSVNDLIKRRNQIKSKLILANATTKVSIAGVEMTIAEVIDQKDFIMYKQSLLQELERQQSLNIQLIERAMIDMESRLDKRLESDFGSKDRKNYADEIEEVTNNFKNRNQPNIVDPISIRSEIEELRTEIDKFLVEVDAVLSEVNATTMIELIA